MKKIFLCLLFLSACTQKYADYDLIRKVDFNKETYQRPTTLMEVLPQGSDELSACFGQWLFFSNAEKEKSEEIPFIVRGLCPRQDYLVNARMTETWWTTIIYSRACVDIETTCADLKMRDARK